MLQNITPRNPFTHQFRSVRLQRRLFEQVIHGGLKNTFHDTARRLGSVYVRCCKAYRRHSVVDN